MQIIACDKSTPQQHYIDLKELTDNNITKHLTPAVMIFIRLQFRI